VQFGGGISAVFLAGAGGVVLGILALLGIYAMTLSAIAVIVYGAVLVLGANSSLHLQALKTEGPEGAAEHRRTELIATDLLAGSSGFRAMAGLAGVVLGILALAGFTQEILVLVALLAMGATIVLAGTALAGAMLAFFRG
jgi:hypothetical protein